jgi:hypothetical protein
MNQYHIIYGKMQQNYQLDNKLLKQKIQDIVLDFSYAFKSYYVFL